MTLPLETEERVRVVARSLAAYDERLDRERVTELAGRHRPAVETAVEKTVSWGLDAEQYLERVFGELSEQSADAPAIEFGGDTPVVVVLPRNDRGDLAPYVLAQCLLAGCPYTVRPSSREAGEYVARTYHECLIEAVRETLPSERAETVVSTLDLLDPAEFGASDLARVAPERVQLVLFGDDATLQSLELAFAGQDVEVTNAIRLGEGRSSSVLVDADSGNLDAHCREIARSAAFDKGDDCTSTSVCYVVGDFDVYEDALGALSTARDEFTAGADFAIPADPQVEAAREQLRAVHPGETLASDRLNVVECTETASVHEFPMPVVQVKRVPDRERLLELMASDFADRDSLVTSVFTDEQATFDALAPELPATLVKHNRPTHDIDLLEPHQGRYLVADLL